MGCRQSEDRSVREAREVTNVKTARKIEGNGTKEEGLNVGGGERWKEVGGQRKARKRDGEGS